MKNVLHFSQLTPVKAEMVGQPVDSGNGYYSYSYFLLPYSGKMDSLALSNVSQILHKRHYSYPFTSLGSGLQVMGENEKGGIILYSVTYHHGD